MSDWQDIATAPKDGSYIVAGRFGRDLELIYVKHCRWMSAGEIAVLEGDWGHPEDYDPAWCDEDDDPIYPTHWIPLPAPIKPAPAAEQVA